MTTPPSGVAASSKVALAHPGLKLQTPNEKIKTDLHLLSDRERWEYLFSLNVWKPRAK